MKKKVLITGLMVMLALGFAAPKITANAAEVNSVSADGTFVTTESDDEVKEASDELTGEYTVGTPVAAWDSDNKITWTLPENGTGSYKVTLYKEDGTQVAYTTWGINASYNEDTFKTDIGYDWLSKMETGKYYFTVYAISATDGSTPISDTGKSGLLDYVKPSKKLPTPSITGWNGSEFTVSVDADVNNGGLRIEREYSEDGNFDNCKSKGATWYSRKSTTETKGSISVEKTGYYRIRVIVLSNDIYAAQDSDPSEWSVKSYDELVSKVTTGLSALNSDSNTTADQLLDFLKSQNKSDLTNTVQTDSAAREQLTTAENKYKSEKNVTVGSAVADDMKDVINGDISMVGAAFNADSANSALTLNVTKPTIEKTVDKAVLQNVVQIDLKLNGTSKSENLDVPIRITMPIPTGMSTANLQILHFHGDGTYETIWPSVDNTNKTMSFTVTSFSVFAVGNGTSTNPFTDVTSSDYYYDSVLWAYSKGVTTGTSATTFSPKNECKRAEVVTFLWRALGSPEPTTQTSPFTDVQDSSKWYYKAVLWAAEKGITTGKGNNLFCPNDVVTRAEFVTFLWRSQNKPSHTIENNFNDLKSGAFYIDAVLWAAEKGVTKGYGSTGGFAPNVNCKRCEVVTFMYRALNN